MFNISDKSELININLKNYKSLNSLLNEDEFVLKKSILNLVLEANETRIYRLFK